MSLGDELWKRFNGLNEGTLWYYRALVKAFTRKRIRPLIEELDRVVTELEKLSNGGRQVLQPPKGT